MMWGWGYGHFGWEAWLPMMIFMFAFLAVIVFTVLMIARSFTSRPGFHDQVGHSSDPKQILAERFARGEIEVDEYLKRKGVLENGK